jgi:hypothetical protein
MGREARINAAMKEMQGKPYRDCMAEIIGVLKKYDMAGAITIVSQERSMFKYHFPTWSCVTVGEDHVRVKAHHSEFPNKESVDGLHDRTLLEFRDAVSRRRFSDQTRDRCAPRRLHIQRRSVRG